MENTEKKSLKYYMRSLHRDIGFFVIGLAVVYALSGIVLIYRNTGFLKSESQIEKRLSPNMKESEIGAALHLRDFKVIKTDGDIVYFKNGTYDKATGIVNYTDATLPVFFEKMNSLHKTASNNSTHLFSTFFGICLLFLAISSFWMFKPKTKMFNRSIILASAGFIITIIILFV